jgi:hypothetical protein
VLENISVIAKMKSLKVIELKKPYVEEKYQN